MRAIKNWFFTAVLALIATAAYSQGTVSGTVIDGDLNQPLPGANVTLKGTSVGTSADFDGKFTFECFSKFRYFGNNLYWVYQKRSSILHLVEERQMLEELHCSLMHQELEGVVVTGIMDVARDRQTPVAVSTIKATEIQEKLGSQEFPEILKSTPSVYTTKQGGGFGDSRINIRGFDQRNTAVMINGMPINDMENGWVYWSNWAGLSDVTSAMQVQRGLGSSKLAISSVGGTINVITKSADKKEGGSVSTSVGNDNYLKMMTSYNTGLMDNGLSVSALMSRTGW